MTKVSAHDVAQQLRCRLPGLGTKKLHKLLYYCQGHHLATFGMPLFHDTISAWDMGPVVGQLWHDENRGTEIEAVTNALSESELNTVGYVVSHYGGLSGYELQRLTHTERPWIQANEHREGPGTSQKISHQSIRRYFSEPTDDDDETDSLEPAVVAAWLSGADQAGNRGSQTDSLDEIRARLTTRA